VPTPSKSQCPGCGGRLDPIDDPPGDGTATAHIIGGDLFGWIVAGLFTLLGLLWWPGYIVGVAVIIWIVVRMSRRRTEYWCRDCQRSWSHEELSRRGQTSAL